MMQTSDLADVFHLVIGGPKGDSAPAIRMRLVDGRWQAWRQELTARFPWQDRAPYGSFHVPTGATGYDPDLMENLRRIVDKFNEQSRSRP